MCSRPHHRNFLLRHGSTVATDDGDGRLPLPGGQLVQNFAVTRRLPQESRQPFYSSQIKDACSNNCTINVPKMTQFHLMGKQIRERTHDQHNAAECITSSGRMFKYFIDFQTRHPEPRTVGTVTTPLVIHQQSHGNKHLIIDLS